MKYTKNDINGMKCTELKLERINLLFLVFLHLISNSRLKLVHLIPKKQLKLFLY